MKTYIAYLNQGQGCDYTIGCGKTLITIEANSMEEAAQKLEETISEYYSHSETSLESATLYEVSQKVSVNVFDIYVKRDERIAAESLKEREEEEKKRI